MKTNPPSHPLALDSRAGFFTVEVVAAMVTAAVLAITAGAMLFYGYSGWHKNISDVEVQRDATFAMDMISRAVRSATETNVTVGVSDLRVTTANQTVAFQGVAGDLIYDPDTGAPGDSIVLVSRKVLTFTPLLLTNEGVSVDLQLQDDEETTRITTLYGFRN